MRLHGLKSVTGNKRVPKRASRGTGSGLSRNAGKGEKGQDTRSGDGARPGFEGGQMPLYRRSPKRGFTNIFAKQYVSINVDRLNIFENRTGITPEVLLERRVINRVKDGVKILRDRTLEKSLTVRGCKFSKSIAEKIGTAGGKVEVI